MWFVGWVVFVVVVRWWTCCGWCLRCGSGVWIFIALDVVCAYVREKYF